MAKEEFKYTAFKRSPIYIVLLLVIFSLTKIGQIPIIIIKIFFELTKLPHRFLRSRLTIMNFENPILLRALTSKPSNHLIPITAALLSILIFYTYLIFQLAQDLPSPTKLTTSNKPLTTEVYDRNGKLLYRLYEGKNRSLVELSELPEYLIKATVAIEDKRFYKHAGFDPLAIIRAFREKGNGSLQGASTITQQLIKNTLLTPEQTYTRKIKEIFLSFWAERIYSKNDILQMYFNEAPYGGPAWGIEAAAEI